MLIERALNMCIDIFMLKILFQKRNFCDEEGNGARRSKVAIETTDTGADATKNEEDDLFHVSIFWLIIL